MRPATTENHRCPWTETGGAARSVSREERASVEDGPTCDARGPRAMGVVGMVWVAEYGSCIAEDVHANVTVTQAGQ